MVPITFIFLQVLAQLHSNMTLPSSGAISFSNVDTELNYSSTAQISLNDSAVRSLFGVSSGQISMSNGYGKTADYSFYAPSGGAYLSYNSSPISYTNGSTFTVECFVYLTSFNNSDYYPIVGDVNPSGGGSAWTLAVGPQGQMFMFSFNGSNNRWQSNETIPLNQWVHLAWVAQSGTVYMYINGTQCTDDGSSQGGGNSLRTSGQHFTYCSFQNNNTSVSLNGYASNLRCNTNALYTSNFTPPTSVLTNISGTTLLACRYPSLTTDGSGSKTITVHGSPSVSTFVPF